MNLSPAAERIFTLFADAGHEVYLVGGTVRDRLAGFQATEEELDFAAPTLPDETERILRRGGLRTFAVGKRYGTIGAIIDDLTVEVTTFRCEEKYATGSRHPEVTYGGTIETDLARRDFTMNALALARDGTLVDPFNGVDAIHARRIEVPGEVEPTMRDDPLRLLRLARFIAQLGFQPTPELARGAEQFAFLITSVSRERWRQEMDKLLVGDNVADGLEFLMRTRLLAFMMPELIPMRGSRQRDRFHHKDVWEHTKQTLAQALPIAKVRWALLFHDCGKPYVMTVEDGETHFFYHEVVSNIIANSVMSRLRFPKEQRRSIAKLVSNHMRPNSYDGSWNDSAVRRLRRDMGEDWEDMLAMSRADITSRRAKVVKRSVQRLEDLARRADEIEEAEGQAPILPKGLGTAIMEMFGLAEGPAIGKALAYLRAEVDAGRLRSSREIPYYVEALRSDYTPFAEIEVPDREHHSAR